MSEKLKLELSTLVDAGGLISATGPAIGNDLERGDSAAGAMASAANGGPRVEKNTSGRLVYIHTVLR
jgi:hypothetical protein